MSIARLTFDEKSFLADQKRIYLNCGEIHYFRVPQAQWRDRMRKLCDVGGNMMASYMPWLIHEPTEGHFDGFTDVRKFLDTAAEEGLMVLARPGPYQYSELIYAGLPQWLCKNYPEAAARDRHGKPLCEYSMSYLHPVFLEHVKRYFSKLCPILSEYTVENGGPIAMAQPDNEALGIHLWFGGCDFNQESMGFGLENGRYTEFLRKKYVSTEVLEQLYGVKKQNFSEFTPADEPEAGNMKIIWNRDYFDFYCETVAEYLEKIMDLMEEFGLTVPFCHNAASPNFIPYFRETLQRNGKRLLIGSDDYFNLTQKWKQNNPTPQYAVHITLGAKQLQMMKQPFTVLEFPTGTISDWPGITASDIYATLLLHASLGMRGHNDYIFAGGPNVKDTGTTGAIYDYHAPVAADGSSRDSYEVLGEYRKFLEEHQYLLEYESQADFQVYCPNDLFRAGADRGNYDIPEILPEATVYHLLKTGFLTSAVAGGFDFKFSDPVYEDFERELPLIVISNGLMSREMQERISRFIQSGGKVMITPVIPLWDENAQSCTILSQTLAGATCAAPLEPGRMQLAANACGVESIWLNGPLIPARTLPTEATVLSEEKYTGRILAWEKTFPHGGKVVFCGITWQHAMRSHTKMLEEFLRRLDIANTMKCDNECIFLRHLSDGKTSLYFAGNLSSSRQMCVIHKRMGKNWVEIASKELEPMQFIHFSN